MCKEIYQKIKESRWNQGHLFTNPRVDQLFNGIFWIVLFGGLIAILGLIIWLYI